MTIERYMWRDLVSWIVRDAGGAFVAGFEREEDAKAFVAARKLGEG